MDIQKFGKSILKSREQRIQSDKCCRPKILERGVKIDGMTRNDYRPSTGEATSCDLQVFFNFQLFLTGLKINRPVQIQQAELIHMRCFQSAAGSVLYNSNP